MKEAEGGSPQEQKNKKEMNVCLETIRLRRRPINGEKKKRKLDQMKVKPGFGGNISQE